MASLTTKNQLLFNNVAQSYNTTLEGALEQLAKWILNRREWIGIDVNATSKPAVLDYACGTGIVSRTIYPYASRVVGMDVSTAMVSEYNALACEIDAQQGKMYAVQGDILRPNEPRPAALQDPTLWNFDLVVTTMAFHHFDDPALAMKRLSARLRKGGICVVVDHLGNLDPSKHSHAGHGNDSTIKYVGLSRDYIHRIFRDAQLQDNFDLVTPEEPFILEMPGIPRMELSLFMAKGTKVADE